MLTAEARRHPLHQIGWKLCRGFITARLLLHFLERFEELLAVVADFGFFVAIRMGQCRKDATKRGSTPAVLRRKVGPAKKRLTRRQKKHRERPAAPFRKKLMRLLIELIDVRMLFAIHFDADEVLVHQCCRLSVLE